MSFNFTHKNISWKNNSQLTNSLIPSNSRSTESSGPNFKANPIRHWRKQLIPNNTTGFSKATINNINMPGATSNSGSSNACPNCANTNVNFLKTYIPHKSLDSHPQYSPPLEGDSSYNENLRHMVCRACNPEAHRIKSGPTIISKAYHDTMHSYLKSKDKLYDQNISLSSIYIGVSGEYYSSSCKNKCNAGYSKVTYKRSNFKYNSQGAVSSGSRLLNLKYNTVNDNANSFKTAYVLAAANPGKYNGSSNGPYFIKSKESKPECHIRKGTFQKYLNCNATKSYQVIIVDHDLFHSHLFDHDHFTVHLDKSHTNVEIYLKNLENNI